MDIKQAYEILNVSPDISDDELKKIHKEAVKKYHPDLYKDDPDKLKHINSAYQFIKDYRENPPGPFGRQYTTAEDDLPFDFGNFQDIFSNFNGFHGFKNNNHKTRNVSHINLNTEISFKDSVLGIEKEISVEREVKCSDCNGNGIKKIKNTCTNCDGFGKISKKQGNTTFISTCNVCRGAGPTSENCNICNGKTYIKQNTNLKVQIPPGVKDGNTIQLRGAGHFAGNGIMGENYSNIYLNIKVNNNTNLSIDDLGSDVLFPLNISLLEALEGANKIVPTINGDKEVKIPPKSKNKDEVILYGLGVKNYLHQGNQRILINVMYPENQESINKIIELLKG